MKESASFRFEQLLDWIEGRLPAEEAEVMASRLASADETTRATVAWLRAFHQVSKDITLAQLPPELRQQLTDRFEVYNRDRRTPDLFQRLAATLTFDSSAQAAVAGIRSPAASREDEQLLYATTVAEIALNIHPRTRDKQMDLSGQVFPTDELAKDTFVVQLLQETAEVDITTTDDLGEFAFKALNPDVYELVLSSDRVELVIEPLDLGEPRRHA